MFATRALTVVAVGTALVAAQEQGYNISEQCQTTLTNFLTAPEAACFNPSGLVSLVVGTNASTSIVEPINTWLTGLCGMAPCSNASLSTLVTNVTTGCQQEILAEGGGPTDTQAIIAQIQQYYPTVRELLCLKDDAKSQLCLTQELSSIQDIIGPLSVTGLAGMMTTISALDPTKYTNVTCTDCVKATLNTVRTAFPELLTVVDPIAQQQCGAAFTDGSNVSGISQTAVKESSTTPTTNDNGASTLTAGFASLVAVSVVFAALL